MDAPEAIFVDVVVQHAHPATVAAHDQLVGGCPWDPECGDAANDTKDILVEDGGDFHFGAVFVLDDAVQVDALAAGFEYLLVLGLEARNGIAGNGTGRRGRRGESEGVEGLGLLHVGHDGRCQERGRDNRRSDGGGGEGGDGGVGGRRWRRVVKV